MFILCGENMPLLVANNDY